MPEASAESWDVFLSYSRQDAAFMRRLQTDLSSAGLSVWIDDVGLEPGTPAWESAVATAIESARTMVVVLSPHAKLSTWVGRELSYGEQHRVPIFPILADGSEQTALPLRLISSQWVDSRSDYLGALERLEVALLDRLGRTRGSAPAELLVAEEDRGRLQGEIELLDGLRRLQQFVGENEAARGFDLFRNQLGRRLSELGAFATRIKALSTLLGGEIGHTPTLDPATLAEATEELARSHLLAARPRSAEKLLADTIANWRQELDGAATTSLRALLGEARILLGELAGADRILTTAARGAQELGDERQLTRVNLATGQLLTYVGDHEAAGSALDAGYAAASELPDTQLQARARGLRALAFWQMGASGPAIQSAQQARDLAEHLGSPSLAAWTAWLLASVHLSLASITRFRPENLREAQGLLNEAKEICKSHRLPELEVDLLGASGRVFRIKGNRQMAIRLTEQALELAETSEYRLKQADCHNSLARLALDSADTENALRHAAAAYEYAKCDGHRYEAALARARSTLERLGQPPG